MHAVSQKEADKRQPLLLLNTALRLRGCAGRASVDGAFQRPPRGEQPRSAYTAIQIGDLAHARIVTNSRVLWSVQRIKEYVYKIAC